jgi:TIR domain
MNMARSDPKVFLSYARADAAAIDRLCQRLETLGIWYWRDETHLVPGDSISEGIEQALLDVDYVCLCLSRAALTRPWVMREYRAALTRQLSSPTSMPRVIPLLLEPCDLPPLLSDIRYADFSGDWETGFKDLLKSLGKLRAQPLPYLELVSRIDSIESLEDYLQSPEATGDANVDYDLIASVHKGVVSSIYHLEEVLREGRIPLIVSELPANGPSHDFVPVIVSAGVHGISYIGIVDPEKVRLYDGWPEFLKHLWQNKAAIKDRRVFLVPRYFRWVILGPFGADAFIDLDRDIDPVLRRIGALD